MYKKLPKQYNQNDTWAYIFNLALFLSALTILKKLLNSQQKKQYKIDNFYLLKKNNQLVILKEIIRNTAKIIDPITNKEDLTLKSNLLEVNSSANLTQTTDILKISDCILENSFRYTRKNSDVRLLSCHNIQSCVCLIAFGTKGTAIFHFNNNVEKIITDALDSVFKNYEVKNQFSKFTLIGFWNLRDKINPFITSIADTVKKCLNTDKLNSLQTYSSFFDESTLTKNIFVNVKTNQIIIEDRCIKDLIDLDKKINQKYASELKQSQKDQLIQSKNGEILNVSKVLPKLISENDLLRYKLLDMSDTKIN